MKILCDKCGGVVAHLIGKTLIDVVRQGHKMQVVGKDYTVMLSCPNTGECNNKVAITVENGQVLLDNLKRKEGDEDGEPAGTTENGKEDGNSEESKGDEGKENEGEERNNGDGKGDSSGEEGNNETKSNERKYTRI